MKPHCHPVHSVKTLCDLKGFAVLLVVSTLAISCSQKAPETTPTASEEPEIYQPSRAINSADRIAERVLHSRAEDGSAQLPQTSPGLLQALSKDSGLNYQERIHAIQELYRESASLTQEEIDFLLAFLLDQGEELALDQSKLRALKNDILNLLSLRLQDHGPLIEVLEAMMTDPEADPVMRNYAKQFLTALDLGDQNVHASHWRAIQKVTSADQGMITEVDAHLASTSLIHLHSAHRFGKLPESEKNRLAKSALRLASRQDQPDAARLTALQVCGQLKVQQAADLAMELSQSAEASFPLRIAAIATLGQIRPDHETIAYLQTLLISPNPRLRAPAQAAIKAALRDTNS
ncbi:MAG: HEAT repeat domain-containing protein [Verrucomicrobiota bacterium]